MVLADSFYYQPVQIDTINTRVNTDLFAKEGDVNGRGILLTLTENGLVKDTTGIALNLKWEHLSVGNQGIDNFEAVDLSKGLYKITYPIEMLNLGTVRGYIQIIDSGKSAGIRNLTITIERGVGDDTLIVRSDSFTALTQALMDVNNLDKTYAPELLSVKQQLAETNAQVDLLNRGLGETFATLNDLQTAYPTGDTKDHIVGADGHRYFWNDTAWADGGAYQAVELIDGAVTINKTDFIKQDGNLLDYTLVTLNKYLENGNPVNNIWGWGVTNFIEVKEGLSYFASDTQYSFFYDANMSVVSGIASPTLFIIPIGVKYVRFSIENALTYAQKFMVLQTDQVPTHYIPYEYIYTKMHIDDGSITPEKTSFFTSKLNIDINWENAKTIDIWSGKTADATNNYNASDFVNISPNTDYFVGFPHFIYFYSSKGTFLSYAYNSAATVITTLANAYYIRFVIFDITPNNLVFYRGNVPKTYADVTPQLSVDSLKFGITNMDFSVNNLFDLDTFVTGGSINPPDGVEISVPANGRTGRINVLEGERYYINFRFFIFYYNSDGTYITALADSTCYYPKEVSVPDGVSQISLVMADYTQDLIDNAVVLHVEKNTTKSYIPSSYVSPSFDKNNYNNMKTTTLGDSITEGNTWQPFLSSVLGINIIKNAGVGGTTVADYSGLTDKTLYMASDSRINTIPTDTEMLIFMGGSNDWSQNIPIGNISDSTKDTFYGAYQMVLDKVYARVPNARILLMLQPFRKDMYSNANGNVLQDYRDATEKISKKYGYPLVNTLEAGINQLNATTFLQDVVHPNASGGKRIAEVIVGKLKSIEPIV